MLILLPLVPMVSEEKSAVNLTKIFCMWWITSLAAFKILLGFWQFDYDLSRCGSLWVYYTWSLINIIFLIKTGKILAFISLDILSVLFSPLLLGFLSMYMSVYLMESHRSLTLFSFIFSPIFLHSFSFSDWIISITCLHYHCLFLPHVQMCYWALLNFSFQLLYFFFF